MKNPSKWLESAISRIRNHDQEITKHETAILEILLEIEAKKEYANLGFDGLYSFCIKTFGWSESQTATRTQAMYALQAVPAIKEKIDSGSMSVTTVAQVQRYLRQEQTDAGMKRTAEEKLQIFESFERKTSLQVKEEIAQRKGERIKLKILLELDEEAETLWRQVRNLSAHQTRGSSLNCLKILMKSFIDQRQKALRPRRSTSLLTKVDRATETRTTASPIESHQKLEHQQKSKQARSHHSPEPTHTRVISAEIRRKVFERDRHQCKSCESKYALQIDHIQPIAKGGSNDLDNLRLLCRNCNLVHGIRQFGLNKMRRPDLNG